MKASLTLLFIAIGYSISSFACLNGETTVLKNGAIVWEDANGGIIPYGHIFFLDNFDEALKQTDSLWQRTKNISYLSDYGLVLILKKEYEKAKKIYLQIEKIKPGRYSTASNLGTVYELLGENEKALDWINKAIEINPKGHNNSEWLHRKILEAKIKGDQYINSTFLLGADFGTHANPHSNLSNEELLRLRNALYYQLNERISFVQPQDKIMATLLFELSNIAYLTGAKNDAIYIYENQSKLYGFEKHSEILSIDSANIKKTEMTGLDKSAASLSGYFKWALLCFVMLGVIYLFISRLKGTAKTRH